MKVKEIRDLIDFINQSGLNEVNIETDEFKISVKREPNIKTQVIEKPSLVQQPSSTVQQNPSATEAPSPQSPTDEKKSPENGADTQGNYVEIKSPMIGTFYRSSSPEVDPFVKVGDSISKGETVCIVEAMKLFNEIESEVSGKIVKVLVENASPVEYDQPLFLVEPE